MGSLTETSLLPSLWVDRVRSFHRRFCDRVPGRVVSRLAPDRRPARWWPVALSILGWRSLNRVQGESCPTVDRLAGGPRPSPSWGGDPLKDTQVGPTCTVSLERRQRARRTWPSMAISLDPPSQGRHQRSRWSRPGSCRTRTVPVIPRSTRRVPLEISRP